MNQAEDVIEFNRLRAKAARVGRVARRAAEVGTREAARQFGISPNTVTDYLRLSNGIEPHTMTLKFRRNGPRGYSAVAVGRVRQVRGKDRYSVPFSCSVKALTLREAFEAVLHQALATARAKAGIRG